MVGFVKKECAEDTKMWVDSRVLGDNSQTRFYVACAGEQELDCGFALEWIEGAHEIQWFCGLTTFSEVAEFERQHRAWEALDADE